MNYNKCIKSLLNTPHI